MVYDLLDDLERAVLNRCSVFAGGFNLAAAVAVGGSGLLDEYSVLDLLEAHFPSRVARSPGATPKPETPPAWCDRRGKPRSATPTGPVTATRNDRSSSCTATPTEPS